MSDTKMSIENLIPFTSYGLIPYYREGVNIFYLLIQRRDTMEYIEFIMGRYKSSSLSKYLSLMTRDELDRLQNYPFDKLWSDLWIGRNKYKQYTKAKEKHDMQSIDFDAVKCKCLSDAPWGFPKGRKNFVKENVINVAVREFEEETKLSAKNLYVNKTKVISETFRGSDNKIYCYNFFLANSPNAPIPARTNTPNCIRQTTISDEVMNVKWVTFEDGIKMLDEPFKNILRKAHETLKI